MFKVVLWDNYLKNRNIMSRYHYNIIYFKHNAPLGDTKKFIVNKLLFSYTYTNSYVVDKPADTLRFLFLGQTRACLFGIKTQGTKF